MRINIRTFLWTIGILSFVAFCSRAADEILLQGYIKGEKGFSKIESNPGSVQIDWNGAGTFHSTTITGTTAYVALFPSAPTTNGMAYCRNLSTDTVWTISFTGGTNDHLQLKPGEFSIMRIHASLALTNVKGKGGVTNTSIQTTILEN